MKVRFKVQNCIWEESGSQEPTTLKIGYPFGYRLSCVCVCLFVFFFFFFKRVLWLWCFSGGSRVLFTRPTNLFFFKTFIKNESHDTIHTFKNYFTIIFSVFSFSNNKFNSNGPILYFFPLIWCFVFFSPYYNKM